MSGTAALYDWMGCSGMASGGPVVNVGAPWAAGSTPIYTDQIVDPYGTGIPASAFSALTLSIVDTLSGTVINNVNQTNILNTGRGSIDSAGNLTISLEAGDTSLSELPSAAQVQRSLIIDWTYSVSGSQPSAGTGRHQVNFVIVALAGA
ncbi:MAG: hypothetical protein KGL39_47900 [Patescibacteria group bacterium]|nr:hypothetical protein [Patescibacteria group bacterium]